MRKSLVLGLAAMAWAGSAVAEPAPVVAENVIDNDQVTVWDLTLKPGQQGPVTPKDRDTVVMYLEGGTIKSDGAAGSSTTDHAFGDAVFVPRGSNQRDTLVKGGPVHEVVVWLKKPLKPIANPTHYPLAFPRPGVVKTLDNDRVVAWRYTWLPGTPTPVHFHDKYVVVAYRYAGALKSTTPDGQSVVNSFKAGEIRFNAPNRVHSELLSSDKESAAMLELKQ
jgi:predicted metal-dependent enzyme (double-stranded beta helix superfamily)